MAQDQSKEHTEVSTWGQTFSWWLYMPFLAQGGPELSCIYDNNLQSSQHLQPLLGRVSLIRLQEAWHEASHTSPEIPLCWIDWNYLFVFCWLEQNLTQTVGFIRTSCLPVTLTPLRCSKTTVPLNWGLYICCHSLPSPRFDSKLGEDSKNYFS